jgi:hypothetical protein
VRLALGRSGPSAFSKLVMALKERHVWTEAKPPSVCQQRVVARRAYYDLNTSVFTMSKSGPVSKGATIVIAPTTADTVVNERPSSIFAV